jgi:hypothetical protein
MSNDPNQNRWKAFTEEIEVAGNQLVERVNELLREGNVRSLRLKSDDGKIFLELPLTVGAGIGGVVALAAPWLAVLAALAGVFARVRIEVVRNAPTEPDSPAPGKRGPDDIDI